MLQFLPICAQHQGQFSHSCAKSSTTSSVLDISGSTARLELLIQLLNLLPDCQRLSIFPESLINLRRPEQLLASRPW